MIAAFYNNWSKPIPCLWFRVWIGVISVLSKCLFAPIRNNGPKRNSYLQFWITCRVLERSESRASRPKSQNSFGNIVAGMFWYACSIIFIDYLEEGKAIIGEFSAALLDNLNSKIRGKIPCKRKTNAFHQYNAPNHIPIKVIEKSNICTNSVFSKSGSQLLLFVSKLTNVAPSDEICVKWGCRLRNLCYFESVDK